MSESHSNARSGNLVDSRGPWPFTTRKSYHRPGHPHLVWRSRHHRKGLHVFEPSGLSAAGVRLLKSLWMPWELNWWIGVVFALGALLFIVGCILSLAPAIVQELSLQPNTVNAVFFAGSIPFTTAAYLQLLQAANAGEFAPNSIATPVRTAFFGWRPHNIGWLSCALQFLGTLLFNVNTFDAMIPGLNWFQQDLEIWVPNFVGSVLFLASGHLAFAETGHAHFSWKPASLSWWVTFVNLLGCVAFMISAVFAFVPPKALACDALTASIMFTLIGAVGFLFGSLLMLPESARSAQS